MTIHTSIRNVLLQALKKTLTGATLFDGRPALVDVTDLPAVAVYLTEAKSTGEYLDGDRWQAVLHVEIFLKSSSPDSALDAWMEKEIYPAMQNISALDGLIESLKPMGYNYRRDEETPTWGSADLLHSITYIQ
ncbi:phage tail terminator protein [Serratia aquatilis]|uniref:Phage tail terminator protein n=1 Tax=Serratia aquatilis TaxID=1737515 RepID=A0ABV6EGE5_9GAMM